MQSKKISFPNTVGERLAGVLDLPAETPLAYALFAHCFTCSKNLKAATNISRAMTDAGIAVLRFDFTGLGQSDGAFEDTNFSSNVPDLISAARWLEQEYRYCGGSSCPRWRRTARCRRNGCRPKSVRLVVGRSRVVHNDDAQNVRQPKEDGLALCDC